MAPDLSRIKAFAFDVDGVLTNGGILCTPGGDLWRTYDAKDGFGLRMAMMNGYTLGVITGGTSTTILDRFLGYGMDMENVHLHSRDKMKDFRAFCSHNGLAPEEVMYFGDDLPDVAVIRAAGIGVAPADAVQEAKDAADIVAEHPGGKGCIREMVEKVMKLQGRWVFDTGDYEKKF